MTNGRTTLAHRLHAWPLTDLLDGIERLLDRRSDYVAPPTHEAARKAAVRAKRLAEGKCSCCRGLLDNPAFKACTSCRDHNREYKRSKSA